MQRTPPLRCLLSAAVLLPIALFAAAAPTDAQVDVAVGELPSGGTITIEIVVTAPAPAPAGLDAFSTQGTVSGGNFDNVPTDDPDAGGTEDPTITLLSAVPDLTLTKSYTGPTPQPGDTLAFDLDFSNGGNQGATGVTITETVPTHTTFNMGASTGVWSCPDGSPAGTACDLLIGGLAGGGAGSSEVFAVDLVDPLPPGASEVVNTVTIADDGANGVDPNPGDNSDTETVGLDSLPPTVTLIDTEAATPGGELAECETATVGIAALLATFSEEVQDPPGDTDPNDVTNPDNYLLVEAGPNFAYDTFGCGGAGGDDVEVPIAGVTYDAVADVARLDLGGVIGDGLHRLFICSDVRDVAGNPLDGDGNGVGGDDFVRSFRTDLGNVFANGFLDCDRPPWMPVSSTGATQSWDPAVDADGSPDSGSAAASVLVGGGMPESAALGQCAEVFPGFLDLGGRARVDTDDVVSLTVDCEFWSEPACAAGSLGTQSATTVIEDTGGAFTAVGLSLAPPPASSSAACSYGWDAAAGVTFDAWLDNLRGLGPLFADGFETGDTSRWTEEVP